VSHIISFIAAIKVANFTQKFSWAFLGFFVSHFVSIKYLHKKTPKITNGFHKKKYAARKKRKNIDFKAYSSEPSFSLFNYKSIFEKVKFGHLFLSNF